MDQLQQPDHRKIDDQYVLQRSGPRIIPIQPGNHGPIQSAQSHINHEVAQLHDNLQPHHQQVFVKSENQEILMENQYGQYKPLVSQNVSSPVASSSQNPGVQYQYSPSHAGQPVFLQSIQEHSQPQPTYQYDYSNQRKNPIQQAPPQQPFFLSFGAQQSPYMNRGAVSASSPSAIPVPIASSLPQVHSAPTIPASFQTHKRKKSRKGDHALPGDLGDNELKQLAFKTFNVPLTQLALNIKRLENEDVQTVEDSSPSIDAHSLKETKERQRQLFGMVWLLNSCESSPTAVVPRNRIYARYVQVCADNNLTPLSPASFGKLVRILFPNLTTRRLGMRGQSKYHYCGMKLNGDQNVQLQAHQQQHLYQPQPQSGLGITGLQSHLQVQSPISSSNSSVSFDDSPLSSHTPSYTPINSPSIGNSNSISDQLPLVSHLKYVPNLFALLNSNAGATSNPSLTIQLPSIYPYLPRDTDYDIADTLYSLYKVHVNSLFESLRFMQVDKLFSSFSNYNSILTAPVFKLYTHENITEWVRNCDVIMYKRMIRMLSKLQLQFLIPQEVLTQLKEIAAGFVKNVSNNLLNNKVSKNFVVMKLRLAKNFVNLLNRLIKVIETGQSASRILGDHSEKQAMLKDWIKLDMREIVSREIPCGEKNIEVLLHALDVDLQHLLNIGQDLANAASDIMFNISSYIAELPGKFNSINPRLFILLTSNLLTTCLREISLTSGQGFGAWWIVRCWIDEYLSWCFEIGGFLQEDLAPSTMDTVLASGQNSGGRNSGIDSSNSNEGRAPKGPDHGNDDPNISGLSASNLLVNENTSHVQNSNLSFGLVDLLDGSYGAEVSVNSSILGGNNFSSGMITSSTGELLLNYDHSTESY